MLRRISLVVIVCLLIAVTAAPAAAQRTIFLVRHAERADSTPEAKKMMGDDPDLSAAGFARAESLAMMLKDAKITTIYTTEYKRTQQTAAPLAKMLGITPVVQHSKSTPQLLKLLQSSDGNVLVVGHSNTVPEIIKALGVKSEVKIHDDAFDNLFLVVPGSQPVFTHLHFR